ncbi:deoxyguanosinetriphosphate triphosphohydrolase [Actinomadura rayongensis]|uniref:Deoxyguanosinetriphosphate triphosphohydrolase n=1 Tax=Actinomadura rayongensis TaxID=1429076 RepID=A0A6I4W0H1_9ACTN|nr:deoxyguanosinetriphosphate triphosphohydrolase [Actinomadura rayongensis]MXQ63747.1 deoxyguanosinetriphosphate triphosphohydrolase [Actinomadura rayongensis]
MNDYSDRDRRRWAPEPPKRRGRGAFERDRARVLHSAALRRLAAKTQVASPGAEPENNVQSLRTRLTHSLECAQIGRELGRSFGCDPDVVETACLSHDIGHPPFGHNGEAALDEVARACGGFEGNAQSLRVLTRLEPKSFAPDGPPMYGRSVGLNLTRASLDAAMKYPWSQANAVNGKFGVYQDDMDYAGWIREGAPDDRTCFEAQVMDWSDDVAYSVHDLEDAFVAGHIDVALLADPAERRAVAATAVELYCTERSGEHPVPRARRPERAASPLVAEPAELEERFTALLAEPYWPVRYDGTARSLAALKNLTSSLIGRFCLAAEKATRHEFGDRRLTRYGAELIVPRAQRLECAVLKGITAHYVWISHERERARQRELVLELADLMLAGAPATLDPAFREAFTGAADDAARLRAVIDQIASLTDTSAIARHAALTAGRNATIIAAP